MSKYLKTLPIIKGITYVDILCKSYKREIKNETNEIKKKLKQQELDNLIKKYKLNKYGN